MDVLALSSAMAISIFLLAPNVEMPKFRRSSSVSVKNVVKSIWKKSVLILWEEEEEANLQILFRQRQECRQVKNVALALARYLLLLE